MRHKAEESRYVRDLKKQIRSLKIEIASLRKKNRRLEAQSEETEDECEGISIPIEDEQEKEPCRCCGNLDAYLIDIGIYRFVKCEKCTAIQKHSKIEGLENPPVERLELASN